jgi:N4-gp56 family major capsid protein
MATTTTQLSVSGFKQFYDKELLYRTMEALAFWKAGDKKTIPANAGSSVSYRRVEALALNVTPISEAVTPLAVIPTMTEVTATVQQYGNHIIHSDRLETLAIDKLKMEFADVLGQNAGESIDAIVRGELVTGTNVFYATGSTRGAQSAANPLTYAKLTKMVTALKNSKTRPYYGTQNERGTGGKYLGIIHPSVMNDLKLDGTVINTFQYSDPNGIYNWTMQEIGGVAFWETALAPVFAGAGLSGADVYGTFILGKGAFGVPDIGGKGMMEMITKELGSGGTSDPLNQRASEGWKSYQAPKILNNNFMIRFESGTSAF